MRAHSRLQRAAVPLPLAKRQRPPVGPRGSDRPALRPPLWRAGPPSRGPDRPAPPTGRPRLAPALRVRFLDLLGHARRAGPPGPPGDAPTAGDVGAPLRHRPGGGGPAVGAAPRGGRDPRELRARVPPPGAPMRPLLGRAGRALRLGALRLRRGPPGRRPRPPGRGGVAAGLPGGPLNHRAGVRRGVLRSARPQAARRLRLSAQARGHEVSSGRSFSLAALSSDRFLLPTGTSRKRFAGSSAARAWTAPPSWTP